MLNLKNKFFPIANPDAIVQIPHFRYTVLTDRLIRMEYSLSDVFEDHASQTFWFRKQEVPRFSHVIKNDTLIVETEFLILKQRIDPQRSHRWYVQIEQKDNGVVWCYDGAINEQLNNQTNLKGTYRTLDTAKGEVPLEDGLISKTGWSIYDDSASLVFDETGWLIPRTTPETNQDLYFFGYGDQYTSCLKDFFKISGSVPMIPRWILGNWWSRYWAYEQEELLGLMTEFEEHDVPLTVCIVDMDWHVTETKNSSSGWTGYTWNRDLFPSPDAFVRSLHQRGLRTGLNLHPADGVHSHEDAYKSMAEALEINPTTETPIPFDIPNKKFTEAYFKYLHHPEEKRGIDFWWLDWQQGTKTNLKNLDPLYWLNHLHFYDLGRDGGKRPFIFSRWGGLGGHRYPIGFSGDTTVNWESLAFQPYFTSTAANVGYSWWSHDIGGHMGGVEEAELYIRWLQYGVFSPVFRLHCTNNPYHERRPWEFDAETEKISKQAMRLRHALIPYLYSMAWRNHVDGLALIRPMYHEYSKNPNAYECKQQYLFGSELIAAPFVDKKEKDTGLSRQLIWLPEGLWFDFFSGECVKSNDGWISRYGRIDETPVYAKAGAIVPMDSEDGWGYRAIPDSLTIKIFPGASNNFMLYEDDGESQANENGVFVQTRFVQSWEENCSTFTIAPPVGDLSLLPKKRFYTFEFLEINHPSEIKIVFNGIPCKAHEAFYDEDRRTLTVKMTISTDDTVAINLCASKEGLISQADLTLEKMEKMLWSFKLNSWKKQMLLTRFDDLEKDASFVAHVRDTLTFSQMLVVLELKLGLMPFHPSENREEALWFLAKQMGYV